MRPLNRSLSLPVCKGSGNWLYEAQSRGKLLTLGANITGLGVAGSTSCMLRPCSASLTSMQLLLHTVRYVCDLHCYRGLLLWANSSLRIHLDYCNISFTTVYFKYNHIASSVYIFMLFIQGTSTPSSVRILQK